MPHSRLPWRPKWCLSWCTPVRLAALCFTQASVQWQQGWQKPHHTDSDAGECPGDLCTQTEELPEKHLLLSAALTPNSPTRTPFTQEKLFKEVRKDCYAVVSPSSFSLTCFQISKVDSVMIRDISFFKIWHKDLFYVDFMLNAININFDKVNHLCNHHLLFLLSFQALFHWCLKYEDFWAWRISLEEYLPIIGHLENTEKTQNSSKIT